MAGDRLLRDELRTLLDGGRAHARAADVLKGFPRARAGERLHGFAHSAWELLEHLRIAQEDILRYGLEPGHRSPPFPKGLWPKKPAPPDARAWTRSARAFLADLRRCERIARDGKVDLLAPIAHAGGTCWLHGLFLIADHNAYHLGQLMLLRRALEAGGAR
jgi:hypothetical protein